ncbi:helix-turn-helix domain-containing protein [Paramicrobacterium fandaimingii]|uniref:helix-turn-helix domain-containing protein n=1 Tax=Paramicrobacterium fandaimingii TaxID=2708079 RepID=UPI003312FFE1
MEATGVTFTHRTGAECATGETNTVVAERLGVTCPTVVKWRSRFLEHSLDGLVEERLRHLPTFSV